MSSSSLADLSSKVSVDDAQLKGYYRRAEGQDAGRFSQAEQRRVGHILLAVNDPEDAAVKAKEPTAFEASSGGRRLFEAGEGVFAGSGLREPGRRSRLGGSQDFCRSFRRRGFPA